MRTRATGKPKVSAVGMGCMAFSHGYGKVSDEDYAIEAIRGAVEVGTQIGTNPIVPTNIDSPF